jgi:hypothetical protein
MNCVRIHAKPVTAAPAAMLPLPPALLVPGAPLVLTPLVALWLSSSESSRPSKTGDSSVFRVTRNASPTAAVAALGSALAPGVADGDAEADADAVPAPIEEDTPAANVAATVVSRMHSGKG